MSLVSQESDLAFKLSFNGISIFFDEMNFTFEDGLILLLNGQVVANLEGQLGLNAYEAIIEAE